MDTTIFADPSIAGPDVLFSTGTTVNGVQTWAPDLPDIAGAPDAGWNVTQWNTPADQIFDPDTLTEGAADALLGPALAAWNTGTASDGSSLAVFGSPGDYTFRVGGSGGSTRDTFLQTTGYAAATTTFDHPLVFTADERVASAAAGGGTAIAFNAFTVFFNAQGNPSYDPSLPSTEIFLQVPLVDFRGEPGAYTTVTAGDTYQQVFNLSSQYVTGNGTVGSDASVDYLPFAPDTGALHAVRIDLNQALLRLVETLAGQDPSMASAWLDLSRWSLGSYYGGVETSAGSGGPESLALDIAHPTVTTDDSLTVSSATPLSTVQSIDNNGYADVEADDTVSTLPGTTNSITLAPGDGLAKTVTSNGNDTVSVGAGETVSLHALGTGLAVTGESGATVAIDGSAPITTSGTFGTLSLDSDADHDLLGGATNGGNLSLGGNSDQVALDGQADASLSGRDDSFAAGGGTVSLFNDDDAVDMNGAGSQTVFLNGHDAFVGQTGTGSQVVVGTASQTGRLQLQGGHGTQTLWTGGTSAAVTASDDAGSQASLTLRAQPGSTSTVQLGDENTLVDAEGGAVTINGGANATATVTVFDNNGPVSIWGGAEQLMASDGDGALQVQAGSGSQTLFGGAGSLEALGSHAVAGLQTIVNGAEATQATTVFGGRTAQTVWTGNAHDTIVSSTLAGDASGSIAAFIQGGASSYWGGTEQATLDNQGGALDAFLNGDGRVSILAEMTGRTGTSLHGFDSKIDTLVLGGATTTQIHAASSGGGTVLTLGGSVVTLVGTTHVDLSATSGGVLVTG